MQIHEILTFVYFVIAVVYFVIAVEVRFGYLKRPYMATVDLHVLSILLAFNTVDQLAYNDLEEVTQLADRDLLRLLQILVDAKIIVSEVSNALKEERIVGLG